jgi:hypothetical protein
MDSPVRIFQNSEFVPCSKSLISIEDAREQLHRKTSIDKMIQTHNEILLRFFSILEEMEKENKKSKCCIIS